MIGIIVCAALFAAGHVVRDGLPDLHTLTNGRLGTHAARALGGALCGLGALGAYGPSWVALALWAAVWAGFYLDMKHGEANEGTQPYAVISGSTSVFLAVVALCGFGHYLPGYLVIFVGPLKQPIWLAAYRVIPQPVGALFPPTRVAAGVFGLLFGLAAS